MDSIVEKDFSAEEWRAIQRFTDAINKHAVSKVTIVTEEWDMLVLAEGADLNTSAYPKEGLMMHALWIIFFSQIRRLLPPSELKYQSVALFLTAYNGKFDDHTSDDQKLLCETANWMNEMFKYLSARKNKGLAIQMIPKLVEGWGAKYVTGSGQTKATADRVLIFETEGGVQPAHRGGRMAAGKRPFADKTRRPVKIGDSIPFGCCGPKKKKMKKMVKKLCPYLLPHQHLLCEPPRVNSDPTFIDYENADTDVDTDASGNTDDLYSHLTLASAGSQHPSSEMTEYFDIFRNIMALPSNPNLSAEIVQTSVPHPSRAPQIPLGTTPALGPSNFQPLFDFSLQGGPTSLLASSMKGDNLLRTRERHWQGPSPQPPPLKRAYSWESDYVIGGDSRENTAVAKFEPGNENSTENCVAEVSKAEPVTAHAPPTFLFDDYLTSHP